MKITVKLPDSSDYIVRSLLADGDTNTKLRKSNKASKDYITAGLSLAPANSSGHNVCASSSPGCKASCLFYQGKGAIPSVKMARLAKTLAYFQHRKAFKEMLINDISRFIRKANKQRKVLAVRLNVLSDIKWERAFPVLFKLFPDVQFYDYTKHIKRINKDRPTNYHLTFSRSEKTSITEIRNVVANNVSVAVVFENDNFPVEWNGIPVINGDETDLRFLDETGVIVGLKAKGSAKKNDDGFVIKFRKRGEE